MLHTMNPLAIVFLFVSWSMMHQLFGNRMIRVSMVAFAKEQLQRDFSKELKTQNKSLMCGAMVPVFCCRVPRPEVFLNNAAILFLVKRNKKLKKRAGFTHRVLIHFSLMLSQFHENCFRCRTSCVALGLSLPFSTSQLHKEQDMC